MTRTEQLADAYELVATANHYMVGIIESVTADERDAAKTILIRRQNALPKQSGVRFDRLELALDLIEHEERGG